MKEDPCADEVSGLAPVSSFSAVQLSYVKLTSERRAGLSRPAQPVNTSPVGAQPSQRKALLPLLSAADMREEEEHGLHYEEAPLLTGQVANAKLESDSLRFGRAGHLAGLEAAVATSASPLCPGAAIILPVGTAALVVISLLVALRVYVVRTSEAQAARSIYLMINFILVMNYTIVILDSFDLCAAVGLSGGASGRMVGMYMLGFCFGSVCMWLLVRGHPHLWRDSPQRVLIWMLTFQFVGSALYTFVSHTVVYVRVEHGLAFSPFMRSALPVMLMSSRFISGLGSGSCQQFYVGSMLHLTPVAARSTHTARWVFSGMIAIGIGPMVAAALQELEPCGTDKHYDLVGWTQVLLAVGSLATVAWLHPDLTGCGDSMETDSDDSSPAQENQAAGERRSRDRWQRKVVVFGCLCMASLRAFGVSAIEVVIAMLLEEVYAWDQRIIGLTIGAVFLCCIPLKILHSLLAHALSVVGWIRLLTGVALMGSCLLCKSLQMVLRVDGAEQLIVAAIVVFPTLYLSDALGSGIMHQHVLAEGSLFDGNHAQLWYNLMQGMGRFLGPWIARSTVQVHGQDAFAAQQLAVALAFLCIFETCARPYLRIKDETKQCDAGLRQVSL
uniref:Major facilitator superfamily associated domain-containing protein n=1 Tax=Alexandrium monilatum TaxID=311494 RepID=A0A7S4VFB8_9DINO